MWTIFLTGERNSITAAGSGRKVKVIFMVNINLYDEENYLISKTGICPLEVHEFMIAQTAYYEKLGLIIFTDDPENVPASSSVVVDNDKLCEYVSNLTGIDFEVCEQLSLADLEYLTEHDAVKDIPIEYDMLDRVIGRLDQRQRHEVLDMIRLMYDME